MYQIRLCQDICKDKGSNSHGSKLIDLCKAASCQIVNGRLYDDFSIGKFTYCGSQGSSTIDYVISKESSFKLFSHFSVGDFNEFSDHAPIYFNLNFTGIASNEYENFFSI